MDRKRLEERLAHLEQEKLRREANIQNLQAQIDAEVHQINACLGGIQTLQWALQDEDPGPA